MAVMTVTSMIDSILELKSANSLEVFAVKVAETPAFMKVVWAVTKTTTNWAKSVGLLDKKEEKKSDLTAEELLWERYFKDHKFNSSGEVRNFSDAISIITGIDVNRFIVIGRPEETWYFASYIVVAPTGNSVGHNYRINEPIMGSGSNSVFVRDTGQSGNNLSNNPEELRLVTDAELQRFLVKLCYSSGAWTERLCSYARTVKE